MNVLFLTDSLGHPRVNEDKYIASDTWTYMTRNSIQEKYLDKVNFYFDMKLGRDSCILKEDCKYFLPSYNADIIVLQIGIVDCYPRALKRKELAIIKSIPFINRIVHALIKKYYCQIVKFRKISYVSESLFKENLLYLKKNLNKVSWLVIPIAPANNYFNRFNPILANNIKRYNDILYSVFQDELIEDAYTGSEIEKLFLSDHHHLSIYGQNFLGKKIINSLLERIKF